MILCGDIPNSCMYLHLMPELLTEIFPEMEPHISVQPRAVSKCKINKKPVIDWSTADWKAHDNYYGTRKFK